jgi:hypothetical protein
MGAAFAVALAALPTPSALAQRVPAGDDSVRTVTTADSLERSARATSVVLASRPLSALTVREPAELDSAGAGVVAKAAFARDSAASGKGRHILLGMAIGTAAGGGLGYLAGKAWCDSHDEHSEGPPCEIGLPPLVALSAFVGLLAGGIIGAHAERELPGSPAHRVAIDAVPLGARHDGSGDSSLSGVVPLV